MLNVIGVETHFLISKCDISYFPKKKCKNTSTHLLDAQVWENYHKMSFVASTIDNNNSMPWRCGEVLQFYICFREHICGCYEMSIDWFQISVGPVHFGFGQRTQQLIVWLWILFLWSKSLSLLIYDYLSQRLIFLYWWWLCWILTEFY